MKASAYNSVLGLMEKPAEVKAQEIQQAKVDKAKQELANEAIAREWSELPRSQQVINDLHIRREKLISQLSMMGGSSPGQEAYAYLYYKASELHTLDKVLANLTTGKEMGE